MAITANSGPQINFGITQSSSGAVNDYNEERGPSINDLGEGTLDPRPPFLYRPGNRPGVPVYAWPGCFGGPAVDFVPITADTSGIAATFSASAAAGTAQITVQTSATSSSFRAISSFVPSTYPTNTTVSVLMIDGYQMGVPVGQGSTSQNLTQGIAFGQAGTVNIWNPLIMGGRALTITNAAAVASSQATVTIKGFDIYAMAMSATVVGPVASSTVTVPKAFKYIISSGVTVTNAAAGSSVLSIGVADTFGFPMYVDHPNYATVWVGPPATATVATAAAQHTFGYGSSAGMNLGSSLTAASSLGDVRGTYTSTAASNGTATSSATAVRIAMSVSPKVYNLGTVTSTNFWGFVGLPQA